MDWSDRDSRARSIKTRIETSYPHHMSTYTFDSRARSIKTRIETDTAPGNAATCALDSRARSIKTRIETVQPQSEPIDERMIREQDPLKQGLKRESDRCQHEYLDIREQDPLKQGLKHGASCYGTAYIEGFASKIH